MGLEWGVRAQGTGAGQERMSRHQGMGLEWGVKAQGTGAYQEWMSRHQCPQGVPGMFGMGPARTAVTVGIRRKADRQAQTRIGRRRMGRYGVPGPRAPPPVAPGEVHILGDAFINLPVMGRHADSGRERAYSMSSLRSTHLMPSRSSSSRIGT